MFKNTSLKTKFGVIAILIIAGYLINIIPQINAKRHHLDDIKEFKHVLLIVEKTSALIHSLQMERGLSISYLATKDEEFKSKLLSHHRLVDDEVSKLFGVHFWSIVTLPDAMMMCPIKDGLQIKKCIQWQEIFQLLRLPLLAWY